MTRTALAAALALALGASASHAAARPARRPTPAALDALRAMLSATFDPARAVEIDSPENSFFGEQPFVSAVSYAGGVWLLRQWSATGGWRRYGMTVRHGRAYFASFDGTVRLEGQACAQCHSNGPRQLHGVLRSGTAADLAAVNARIADAGLVAPYFPPADPRPAAEPLADATCRQCHNGRQRSPLTRSNGPAIRYLVLSGHMPPQQALPEAERSLLLDWLDEPVR